MAELKFYGPFHFDEFDNKGLFKDEKKRQTFENPNKPGIYIWGFMYKLKGSKIDEIDSFTKNEPILDNNNMKFIPYYVGKHESNLFKRLMQHQKVRQGDAIKYTRLSFDYLKRFFIDKYPENPEDPNFPIHCGKKFTNDIIHLIEKDSKKVIYFNNKGALEKIYKKEGIQLITCDNYNYPNICQKKNDGNQLDDTLYKIIDTKEMNNFWFCYAIQNSKEIIMKDCETYTFYSLKGKTIGKTDSFDKVNLKLSINEENVHSQIFKDVRPSKNFPGYDEMVPSD
jgi:hypothetical protein